MATNTPLMVAARAVREARSALGQVDAQLGEVRAKAQSIEQLRVKLDSAKDQRAQMLESALLEGRTADTTNVDKEITAAERAVAKRHDEATAVSRAVETLETRREQAQAAVSERESEYNELRRGHVGKINLAGYLADKCHAAIWQIGRYLEETPEEFREHLRAALVKQLQGDGPLSVDPVQELADREALRRRVTSSAEADLGKADEHAGIAPPQEPRDLGFVWADGSVHQEPPPAPTEPPVILYKPGQVPQLPPGMPGLRRIG